ncbi:MAG: TRAP transporter small permease [Deltaproteobacteria bacterium]|nr:TRAP transporter small permease [Deltaproteobacteria bacterium]
MNILKIIDTIISKLERWLIITLLSAMVTLTFLHVSLRALYRYAHLQWANEFLGFIDWTEIFVRLMVLWITFLGASLLTRDGKHIKIDLMSTLLPKKWQPFREAFLSIGCVLICIFLLKASVAFLMIERSFGGVLFLGLPSWFGQMIIPVGFSLILFRFILRIIYQSIDLLRGK